VPWVEATPIAAALPGATIVSGGVVQKAIDAKGLKGVNVATK
jgi:hypothetical protein